MIMREKYEDGATLFNSRHSKEIFGRSTVDETVKAERITDESPQHSPTVAPKSNDAADDADNYRRTRGRARIF